MSIGKTNVLKMKNRDVYSEIKCLRETIGLSQQSKTLKQLYFLSDTYL